MRLVSSNLYWPFVLLCPTLVTGWFIWKSLDSIRKTWRVSSFEKSNSTSRALSALRYVLTHVVAFVCAKDLQCNCCNASLIVAVECRVTNAIVLEHNRGLYTFANCFLTDDILWFEATVAALWFSIWNHFSETKNSWLVCTRSRFSVSPLHREFFIWILRKDIIFL